MPPLLALVLVASPVKLMAPVFSSVGVDAAKARVFTTELAQRLRAQGVQVVTSDEVAVILGAERQKELLGCADANGGCLAELSNALGTTGTVKGAVAKIDDVFQLQLSVLGNDTKVLAETSARASSERALLDAIGDAAVELAAKLGAAPPPRGRRLRPQVWAPGLLGLIGGAVGGVLLWESSGAYTQLTTGRFGAGEGELLASRGSTYQLAGWLAVGIGGAALLTALIVFLAQEVF
jgi:hypothetical protein